MCMRSSTRGSRPAILQIRRTHLGTHLGLGLGTRLFLLRALRLPTAVADQDPERGSVADVERGLARPRVVGGLWGRRPANIRTVRGIGDALGQAYKAVEGDISGVTVSLGVAFNSTFVALVLSIVIMFALHQLQLSQERLVLSTQRYVDKKLIRHLAAPK